MEGNPFFEKNAEKYAASHSHKKGEDLDILEHLLKPAGDEILLDIGTGTGFTAVRMAPLVSWVTASDPTIGMLNQARKIAEESGIKNIKFLNSSWENLEPENGRYDIITCRRAAHHFHDIASFFSKIYSLLNPGGKFGFVDFTTPEEDNSDFFNKLERIRDNTHVYALKVSDIKRLSKEKGFLLIAMETREEKVHFIKWLYPVEENSREGINCREYLEQSPPEMTKLINYDPFGNTFTKTRVIAILQKPR
ncbi:class I SAM-dependent methyltransferase [Oxyplasma meridianum]|uniref:Class I SAM-dependent methyltransferase n=1 Tax=Oxyplasma meridianum TaxID=3073602 RepID=A0AAX4NF20_9ARCH